MYVFIRNLWKIKNRRQNNKNQPYHGTFFLDRNVEYLFFSHIYLLSGLRWMKLLVMTFFEILKEEIELKLQAGTYGQPLEESTSIQHTEITHIIT